MNGQSPHNSTETETDDSAMDVGVTTSFEFNGVPPFKVEYTEQKDKNRPKTKVERFDNHVGKIDFTPEQEGEYTYVSYCKLK